MGKCVDSFLLPSTSKSYETSIVPHLGFPDLPDDLDEEVVHPPPQKRLDCPSSSSRPIDINMQELFKDEQPEETERGRIDFKIDNLSEKGKKAFAKVIDDLSVREDELDEEESEVIKDLYNRLSAHPNFKDMSPEEVLDVLQLNKEDRKQVDDALQSMISKAEKDLEQVNLMDIFPGIKDSLTTFTSAIQKAVQMDPSLQNDLEDWIKSAKSKVGEDLKGMESLSDEEFSSIALPPERLRNAMKQFMKTPSRLEDVNLDVTNPRDLFVVPKR